MCISRDNLDAKAAAAEKSCFVPNFKPGAGGGTSLARDELSALFFLRES